MQRPDLNLLVTLDVLLEEQNVTRAAERLRLSPSATSRALARLRLATGDPLLVKSGRHLVATPRAVELRARVQQLVQEAEAVLRPAEPLDLRRLARTFTLRTGEGFVESFGAALLARVAAEAPAVRLRFVQKPDEDSAPLRDGTVHLETGVIRATTSPELRAQGLLRDRFVGVVRSGHPLLGGGEVTPARYAAARHVGIVRRGRDRGPVDEALKPLGLQRELAASVAGFGTALALARASDLVASVPERHTATLRTGMETFSLPFPVPAITVSMLWHPRLDADQAHRWLRRCVREACADPAADRGGRTDAAATPP